MSMGQLTKYLPHWTIHAHSCRQFSKKRSRVVVHQSQRPAHPRDIDFSSLNLKYPVKDLPNVIIQATGWTKPPDNLPDLPFTVERTNSTKSLPVYTDYKHGRTKVVTILGKCKGEINQLKSEMEKVVGRPVQIKPGKLVVDGNYHLRLKYWLSGLGF